VEAQYPCYTLKSREALIEENEHLRALTAALSATLLKNVVRQHEIKLMRLNIEQKC
jgi:hypothetical protein